MKIHQRFENAVEMAEDKTFKCTERQALKLYGLLKQARLGDISKPRPWVFQFQACAKWDAWEKEKGKSELHAKSEYIGLVFRFSTGK